MKEREVVHVLNVALLEVGVDAELFSQEVQRIKGFSLGLSDGWNL